MEQKIKDFLNKLNQNGIPLPMLRDPRTSQGSVTLTMFWISFNIAIVTLAGKITNIIGDIDYSNVLWLLGLTGAMYLGRRYQTKADSVEVEGAEEATEYVKQTRRRRT